MGSPSKAASCSAQPPPSRDPAQDQDRSDILLPARNRCPLPKNPSSGLYFRCIRTVCRSAAPAITAPAVRRLIFMQFIPVSSHSQRDFLHDRRHKADQLLQQIKKQQPDISHDAHAENSENRDNHRFSEKVLMGSQHPNNDQPHRPPDTDIHQHGI